MKYLITVLMFFVIISGVYADNLYNDFTYQDNNNLEWVGSWPFGPSQACATDTIRDLCFLQSGGGVYILDVSDPANPVKLSEKIHTDGIITHLSYDYLHKFLFIVKYVRPDNDPYPYSCYLITEIWDISDSQNPQFISEFNFGGYILLKDTLIYIVSNNNSNNNENGYTILNFSDPNNIQEIYFSAMNINDLYIKDSLLFIASDSIYIFNNSDPLNPSIISTIPYSSIFFLKTKDNYLFAAHRYSQLKFIFVFDISDPLNPVIVDSCDFSIPTNLGRLSIILHRDFIYLTREGDLEIIDISDPINCFSYGCFTVFYCWAERIQLSALKEYVFMPFIGYGLITVDVSDLSIPKIVNQIELNYGNTDFSIKNNYLFLPDGKSQWMDDNKLRVIDISDISNPYQVGKCVLSSCPICIEVKGNYAYIGECYDTLGTFLEIVDITNPLQPEVVNTCTLESNCIDLLSSISIKDNLLFFPPDNLFDISDPIKPILITHLPEQGHQMIIENNLGYMINGWKYLIIFDLQDPYNPVQISTVTCDVETFDIQGDYIYLLSMDGYLQIFNISDPYNPWLVSYLYIAYPGQLTTWGWLIDIQGNYVVVTRDENWFSRIHVIDVSDVNNPFAECTQGLTGRTFGLEVMDNYIFVSIYISGLQIYQYPPLMCINESPPTTPLTSITLNTSIFPLSHHSILELSGLPSKGSISIYSVDGRKIFEEEFKQYMFLLDLKNLNISSGVYFIKISDQDGNDLTINKFEVLR